MERRKKKVSEFTLIWGKLYNHILHKMLQLDVRTLHVITSMTQYAQLSVVYSLCIFNA